MCMDLELVVRVVRQQLLASPKYRAAVKRVRSLRVCAHQVCSRAMTQSRVLLGTVPLFRACPIRSLARNAHWRVNRRGNS